jgi:uncharacterized protein (TIGR02271 family)
MMTQQKRNLESSRPAAAVVGLFREGTRAERAIRRLKEAGFTDEQIGVLVQDRAEERGLPEGVATKAGEGAATGAVSGGVLGGLVGLLAGVGALAIPGIGPIIAGGALASTLAGAGIGAAAGGLIGALIGMGVPEEEARYYEQGLREGGILVTVEAGAEPARARQILLDAGADFGPAAAGYAVETEGRGREGRGRVELKEEELRTSKEAVKAGEVRVRKDVVTEEKTIEVPVTREEAVIERRPAAGRPAGRDIGEGEEIRIPLKEEKVRVEKQPVVKEEITVGKRQVQDTETVRGTVRREEARIEDTGGARVREPWRGKERRSRRTTAYTGPERRTLTP